MKFKVPEGYKIDYPFIISATILSVYLYWGWSLISSTINTRLTALLYHEDNAWVTVLLNSRKDPHFPQIYNLFSQTYDANEKKILTPLISRQDEIARAKELLLKTPQSRDLLLHVARLYAQLDDKVNSQHYLHLAKEVDPEAQL